jgi:hypothetical protein
LRAVELWNADVDPEEHLRNAEKCFADINHIPMPGHTSPYITAGVLNFVAGEVWTRPGLLARDVDSFASAWVGVDDAITPIRSHIYSGLRRVDWVRLIEDAGQYRAEAVGLGRSQRGRGDRTLPAGGGCGGCHSRLQALIDSSAFFSDAALTTSAARNTFRAPRFLRAYDPTDQLAVGEETNAR